MKVGKRMESEIRRTPSLAPEPGVVTPRTFVDWCRAYVGVYMTRYDETKREQEAKVQSEEGTVIASASLGLPEVKCWVCRHPERSAIESALVAGVSVRFLQRGFGGEFSWRNLKDHLHFHPTLEELAREEEAST